MLLRRSTSVEARSSVAGATSMLEVPVETTMSLSVVLDWPSTLAIECVTRATLIPRPTDRFACASMSTQSTLRPLSASAPAILMVVVVLPTPPFWFAIAITLATGVSPRSECWNSSRTTAGRRLGSTELASDCDWQFRPDYLEDATAGTLATDRAYPQNRGVVHRFCG